MRLRTRPRRRPRPRIRVRGVMECWSIGVLRFVRLSARGAGERLAFFAIVCLFLGSASTSFAVSRTLEEANRHKILLIHVGSEPQTLDPQLSQGDTEHQIIDALMAGLVENDE